MSRIFPSSTTKVLLTLRTNILTYPLSHRPATNRKEQERDGKMWRLEIVECGLRLRRVGNGCVKNKRGNVRISIILTRVRETTVAVEKQ